MPTPITTTAARPRPACTEATAAGYANSASGFAANIGNSTEGGDDTAYLFGLSGKNALYTDLAIAELYGSSYGEQASGFGLVNASAPASGVNTHLRAPAPWTIS